MIEQLPEPKDLPMPVHQVVEYPSSKPRRDVLPAMRE